MNIFQKVWTRYFPKPAEPLPAGTYHYQAPADAPLPYRMHLRLEKDGQGILILNASTVLHLNQTAAEYIYYLMHSRSEAEVTEHISQRYQISHTQARQDYQDICERLNTLIATPDLDPVTFLDFDRKDPYTDILAPYRLDCAITYQLNENVRHAAPEERVKREMLTQEWFTILDKAWQAGIPHIIFTGGEPTLRNDLPELIAHAEANGQVTGLLTDGLRLAEPDYLHELLQQGLDHVMIVLDIQDSQAWEGLRDTLAEDIAVTVHLTLTTDNAAQISGTLEKLAEMGVTHISLSASQENLSDALNIAQQKVADLKMTLVWDLPVPYSEFNPVSLELEEGDKTLPGSGNAWLYVEPDGDVLPAQGVLRILGNLLSDSWESIWTNR